MYKKKRKKVQSLRTVSLRLLIPLGIAVAGLLVFLGMSVRENRTLLRQYVQDTAELYVGQINRDISQMNSELVYIHARNQDIGLLPEALRPWDAKYYEMLFSIMEQNRILKIRYSEVQFFYVYGQRAEVLITDSGVIFSDSAKSKEHQELLDVLKERGKEESLSTSWEMIYGENGSYIISWYTRDGTTMGCVINLNTILEILQKGIQKYDAIPFVKNSQGKIFLPEKSQRTYEQEIRSGKKGYLFSYPLGWVGEIHLYVLKSSGMLERVLKMQMLFIGLISILLLLGMGIAYGYYGKVMAPMREFVDALDNMDEEQFLNENGKNNILELEFASDKFRTLLRKIQSLKIAVYEKELMEQRAELEYVQEQVRPHFLLNCLSIIHGIADEKQEKEIVKITEVLADYMRYVMKDSKNQRIIRDELTHIASYVEMQKLRYGEDAFSYEVFVDGDLENALVPPLLLQTLVENAIVHEVSLDRKIDISLYITKEEYEDGDYLYISVSDTGDGFSKEVLSAVENDTPIIYNGRKHVGLQNVRRRLALMYGERAGMLCSNMGEHYGAVVEVHLPFMECVSDRSVWKKGMEQE